MESVTDQIVRLKPLRAVYQRDSPMERGRSEPEVPTIWRYSARVPRAPENNYTFRELTDTGDGGYELDQGRKDR